MTNELDPEVIAALSARQGNEAETIITAPSAPTSPLSVEHFMGLVEHRPHVAMLEVKDKDPEKNYRLVANNPTRIRRAQAMGYTIVTGEGGPTMLDSGQVDGRRVAGADELVLMERPEAYNRMHRAALDAKAQTARRGPIESFKDKARSMGVEVEDETREVVGPLELPMFDNKI